MLVYCSILKVEEWEDLVLNSFDRYEEWERRYTDGSKYEKVGYKFYKKNRLRHRALIFTSELMAIKKVNKKLKT